MKHYYKLAAAVAGFFLFTVFGNQSIAGSNSKEVDEFVSAFLHSNHKKLYRWLSDADKQVAQQLLSHPYSRIRAPYWQSTQTRKDTRKDKNAKTLWVLEEIGKEKPITIGVVIENQKIQSIRILKFRESRGWEVKLPGFLSQFVDATLQQDMRLNKQIDGISGATLSVRAVKKIARFALYLQSTLD